MRQDGYKDAALPTPPHATIRNTSPKNNRRTKKKSVAAVYGAVATPSELTIVTDLVKRGPLRALLDEKTKRESLTAATRHRIIKVRGCCCFLLGRYVHALFFLFDVAVALLLLLLLFLLESRVCLGC